MVGAAAVILVHKMMGFGGYELGCYDRVEESRSMMLKNYHTSPRMPISELFSERLETTILPKLLSY